MGMSKDATEKGSTERIQVAIRIRPVADTGSGAGSGGTLQNRNDRAESGDVPTSSSNNNSKSYWNITNYGRAIVETRPASNNNNIVSLNATTSYQSHGNNSSNDGQTSTHLSNNIKKVEGKSFFSSFHHLLNTSATNQEIYSQLVHPLIDQDLLRRQKDVTILTYGATSSGKTYSMLGDGKKGQPGIVQQSVETIFQHLPQQQGSFPTTPASVLLSFFEVYQEQVRDLLTGASDTLGNAQVPKTKSSKAVPAILAIRNALGGGVHVNCQEVAVTNSNQVWNLLEYGNQHRMVASTQRNVVSSRSHAIVRLQLLTTTSTNGTNKGRHHPIATLNLVDLAGSESGNAIPSQSAHANSLPKRNLARRQEGSTINQSLLVLSKVIYALSSNKKTTPFVPYRESKLTRILQPQLESSRGRVLLLACIHPHMLEETRSTLRFAARAQLVPTISCTPTIKKEMILSGKPKEQQQQLLMIHKMSDELQALRQELCDKEAQRDKAMIEATSATRQVEYMKRLVQDQYREVNGRGFTTSKVHGNRVSTPPASPNQSFDTMTTTKTTPDRSITEGHLGNEQQPHRQLSLATYKRSTAKRKPVDLNAPPCQVFVHHQQVSSNSDGSNKNESSVTLMTELQAQVVTLTNRLEATEDFLEILIKDLTSSKTALRQVVANNVELVAQRERSARPHDDSLCNPNHRPIFEEERNRQTNNRGIRQPHVVADVPDEEAKVQCDRVRSRHYLLRGVIHIAILFFGIGVNQIAIAAAMFIWLTLILEV